MDKKLFDELQNLSGTINRATFKKISENCGATTPNKLYEGEWAGLEKTPSRITFEPDYLGVFYFDNRKRLILTSPVKTIIKHDENTYHLETRNSVYELTFVSR